MVANPYNAKKEYDSDEPVERGVQGANDSLAYVKKKKTVVVGPGQDLLGESVKEEPVEEEAQEVSQKYQRVDWKKRHDDLKRHHDNRINELKQTMDDLKQQLRENRQTFKPPKTPEELATFRAENPDIYAVVETVAHMQSKEQVQDLEERINGLQEKILYEEARAAYAELKMVVPDFEEIRSSEDFHTWAKEQPKEIQSWIYENKTNAALAAKAINLYKADRGIGKKAPVQNVDRRGSAADSVKTGRGVDEPSDGKRIYKRSELARMHWKEFERLREDIDLALMEGRITND